MEATIWQSVAETPWWIMAATGFLFYFGYLRSKKQVISLRSLVSLCVYAVVLTLAGAYLYVKIESAVFIYWLTMMTLGCGLGWLHFRFLQIKAIPHQQSILIPGSFLALLMITLIIAAKFYFGYQIGLDVDALKMGEYSRGLMAFYGFFTGILIGRTACAVHVIKHGPFTQVPSPAH